ncbi:MAG: hypothetical protein M1830_003871 [Pleopsidium flavum]|nr:MAG: hypothetical protein M1830_003871 [Pleopsidium flavum]
MTTTTVTRPRVFLDIQIGTDPAGRIMIELFVDKTPKTCENFRAITTAAYTPPSASQPLTYKLSPFHRIIDEFMIQGGDITKGDGTGGASVYGAEFEDENIGWREIDKEGLVCMVNRGKGTNSSQFFITLASCEHLNAKHTVFGHVVQGQQVLQRLAKVRVDKNDRPLEDVLISHCGELERRKKPPSNLEHLKADAVNTDTNGSRDRGRKRRRRSVSDERSAPRAKSRSRSQSRCHNRKHHKSTPSPPPQSRTQDRRRSDMSFDGTLRGRTLTRSPSLPAPTSKTSPKTSASPRSRKRRHRNRSPSRSPSHTRSQSPRLRRQHTRSRSRSKSARRRPRHHELDTYRDDEDLIRRQEEERDGGDERYKGVIEDDELRWQRRDFGPRNNRWGSNKGNGNRNRNDRLDKDDRGGGGGGGGGGGITAEDRGGEVKFKGRGSMKYRERKR